MANIVTTSCRSPKLTFANIDMGTVFKYHNGLQIYIKTDTEAAVSLESGRLYSNPKAGSLIEVLGEVTIKPFVSC